MEKMTEENKTTKDSIQVSCNWAINNNKRYADAITTMPLSVAPKRISLGDIIFLDTCISLNPTKQEVEPCTLDIEITNCQKISRIVVISEAYVLEFYKQYGEYASTVFAELIDEFDGNSIYLAEVTLESPTTEASIKFTKTKNTDPMVWIYGIKLILTEPVKDNESDMLDYTIKNFLLNLNSSTQQKKNIAKKVLESVANHEKNDSKQDDLSLKNKNIIEDVKESDTTCKEDCKNADMTDIKAYINNKFHDIEERTMNRLNEIEQKMNKKLDAILEKLEVQLK